MTHAKPEHETDPHHKPEGHHKPEAAVKGTEGIPPLGDTGARDPAKAMLDARQTFVGKILSGEGKSYRAVLFRDAGDTTIDGGDKQPHAVDVTRLSPEERRLKADQLITVFRHETGFFTND